MLTLFCFAEKCGSVSLETFLFFIRIVQCRLDMNECRPFWEEN